MRRFAVDLSLLRRRGALAGLTSGRTAIVAGGVACAAGSAAVGAAIPALWNYEAP